MAGTISFRHRATPVPELPLGAGWHCPQGHRFLQRLKVSLPASLRAQNLVVRARDARSGRSGDPPSHEQCGLAWEWIIGPRQAVPTEVHEGMPKCIDGLRRKSAGRLLSCFGPDLTGQLYRPRIAGRSVPAYDPEPVRA